ncbi:hypothetical protein N658DRAFT_421395 [Parathielavia hyrcaniae]|uniref:Signal recognition particle subunit SRP68 n=1 Tax=Parathielavia hyrcaniae TaxID=113614 RepID=A0AAN6Q7B2_9PEZI|nr:hypothetical protein N658DRAFT_421395 [Parathielavia hyrcaniae]
MDITKSVLSLREKALLYGDYSTYWSQLSGKLLNCRKKLNIATRNRGKFNPKSPVTPEQIAENHEYVFLYVTLQLLTAERAWAQAMSIKASHSADTKGMTSKTRSHLVSRLDKGARTAESLAQALSSAASGASATDLLDARAYAALLRGAALFEKQSWEACLKSYAVCRIIYSALVTSAKGDALKDLLSETIDPSIRYAAYQAKIPRTLPIATIARKAFDHADPELADQVRQLNPDVLEHGDPDAKKGAEGAAPTTLTWRGREVKIEDAAIAIAWATVGTARGQLSDKLASAGNLRPRDMAGAYDEILVASQDAVDATKQAIDELRAEGVTQGDPRMQSLQITRTAVNFEMISWRIGRNRVLVGENDGVKTEFGAASRTKKRTEEPETARGKDKAPGRQIARLKEKVVLYDGILQSLESIKELPGVANDRDLFGRLEATSQYFTALKSLAIARSHAIAGSAVNSLVLIKHALDQCNAAIPSLSNSSDDDDQDELTPRNIQVTQRDVTLLHDILAGEVQRGRALVDIFNSAGGSSNNKQHSASASASAQPQPQTGGGGAPASKPLSSRLSDYPVGGVDLDNIVAYPPRLEPFPVKPLFLDVAWNYIEYPGKAEQQQQQASGAVTVQQQQDNTKAGAAALEPEAKPQKRGWFPFGR